MVQKDLVLSFPCILLYYETTISRRELHCRATGYKLVVQSLSSVRLFATPWSAACQASLSLTVSLSLVKLMSIESVMLGNYLIL